MSLDSDESEVAPDQTVHHVEISFDDTADPGVTFARALASVKGVKPDDLAPMHSHLDDLVSAVVMSPPPEENQAEIAFSYEGFRVTLYHDGHAVLREIA